MSNLMLHLRHAHLKKTWRACHVQPTFDLFKCCKPGEKFKPSSVKWTRVNTLCVTCVYEAPFQLECFNFCTRSLRSQISTIHEFMVAVS